ncbi:hypothetical protein CRUP_010585 [Coryphaenoides rupestris]|nr:hypothetical protein CRUP_010585 [Coryphaenoides rupestris]
MEVVRYRLIGPQSHAVLTEALDAATDCDAMSKSQSPSPLWWPEHCRDEAKMSLHRQQADVFHTFKGIYSTGEVPPGTVLGLNVEDPRLALPQKRTPALSNAVVALDQDAEEKRRELMLKGVPEQCCQSSLWDRSVRDNVTDNKLSEQSCPVCGWVPAAGVMSYRPGSISSSVSRRRPPQELNGMKRELLVPGSRLSPTPLQGRVPVLLVQQPGKQVGQEMASWGAGWDLLLPKGWGMAFWIPLVSTLHHQHRCPHQPPPAPHQPTLHQHHHTTPKTHHTTPPTNTPKNHHYTTSTTSTTPPLPAHLHPTRMGLKHSQNQGAPHFPHDYPDCPAGARFQEEQEAELLNKFKSGVSGLWAVEADMWCRRPPAKRTNYIKHGCLAPFRCPWQQLTEEWELITGEATEAGDVGVGGVGTAVQEVTSEGAGPVTAVAPSCFGVLRNRKSLKLLSAWCQPTTSKGQRSLRGRNQSPRLDGASRAAFLSAHVRALAWVRVSLLSKGRPELHAAVCVAAPEDLRRLASKDQAAAAAVGDYSGPMEHPHKDRFKSQVKRGKKKGSKKTPTPALTFGQTTASAAPDQGPSPSSSSSDLVLGLWPDPLPSVTAHCSRVTLGWVTQGDFSLSAGCGEALGLVSLEGLVHTLLAQPAEHRGVVLLRNPSSLHYRLAKLNVEV